MLMKADGGGVWRMLTPLTFELDAEPTVAGIFPRHGAFAQVRYIGPARRGVPAVPISRIWDFCFGASGQDVGK